MKSFFLSLALLIAGYTSSFADNYFQDTLWMKKTDQSNGFYMLKFSKNDSIISALGFEKTLFFEAKNGNEIKRIDGNGLGQFIYNDKQYIRIANNAKNSFEIIDIKTWEVIDFLESDSIEISSYEISKDEKYIIAAIKGGLRVWDLQTKKILRTKILESEPNLIYNVFDYVGFDCDENRFIGHRIKTYEDPNNPGNPKYYKTYGSYSIYNINTFDSLDNFVNARGFVKSQNCKYIALKTGSKNGVEIYDFVSKQLLHKFPVNGLNITGMEFSSDEKYLVTTSGPDDNKLIVWDVVTGKTIKSNNDGSYDNFIISHNQMTLACSMGRSLILNKAHYSSTNVPTPPTTLTLYPNPTNGLVNINLQSPILGTANIQITNASGNIVMNIPNILPQNNIITFSVAQIPIGTYLLTVSANSLNQTYKLIKE